MKLSCIPKNVIDNQSSSSLNILLVDDSEENKSLIRGYLKNTEHKIIEASNGLEAIEYFKRNKFHLIFMDVQMPILDGYSATKKIRKLEEKDQKHKTVIIALTAYAQQEEIEKSLESGCDLHLTKPVKKKTLLEIIDKYSKTLDSNKK